MFYLFKAINYICMLGRIFRCCKKKEYIPLTNCDYNQLEHKPRKIITWNIQGLCIHMNQQKTNNIINHLKTFRTTDIICLQEVFENSLKDIILHKLKDNFPYYLLGNIDKRYIVGEDSGLMVLSKYPIKFMKEVIFEDYYFPDRMANKSILYFKVGDLNLMTTHLQSSNIYSNTNISLKQLQLIKDASPFDEFIITGDLNNKFADSYLNLKKNNVIPTWDDEILDYIMPYNYKKMKVISTSVPNINLNNVSDHFPLCCQIKY